MIHVNHLPLENKFGLHKISLCRDILCYSFSSLVLFLLYGFTKTKR